MSASKSTTPVVASTDLSSSSSESKPSSNVLLTQSSTGSIDMQESTPFTTATDAPDASEVTVGDNEPLASSRDDENSNRASVSVDVTNPLDDSNLLTATQDVVMEETDSTLKITPILRTTTTTASVSNATLLHGTRSSNNISKKIDTEKKNKMNSEKADHGGVDQQDIEKAHHTQDHTTDQGGNDGIQSNDDATNKAIKKKKKKKNMEKPKKEKKEKAVKEPKKPKPTRRVARDVAPVARVPPDDTTLGILAKQFLDHVKATPNGVVDLNELEVDLRVPKKQLYDIANMIQGVGLIKKFSKNVVAWTGPLDRDEDDDNEDDDDDDYDYEKMSRRSFHSDDDDGDDDDDDEHQQAKRAKWKLMLARDKVHAIYEEETLLDTWISRLRRVLHTQTNLTCYASDVVKAIFHPLTSSTSQRHCNGSHNKNSNNSNDFKGQTSEIVRKSSLIHPSNFLDDTGKVQWSLMAIHAPHGSLVQVSKSRTVPSRGAECGCRLYVSTKSNEFSEMKANDDYDVVDNKTGTKHDPASIPTVVAKKPSDADSPNDDNLMNVDSMEESNITANGETNSLKRSFSYSSNDQYQERLEAYKRQRRDDDCLDIVLIPTTYNPKTFEVEVLAGSVKPIPDPLPPVYMSTAPTPHSSDARWPTNGYAVSNGNHHVYHRAQITPEDLQSWNFVAQLAQREGISDFFAETRPILSTEAEDVM